MSQALGKAVYRILKTSSIISAISVGIVGRATLNTIAPVLSVTGALNSLSLVAVDAGLDEYVATFTLTNSGNVTLSSVNLHTRA